MNPFITRVISSSILLGAITSCQVPKPDQPANSTQQQKPKELVINDARIMNTFTKKASLYYAENGGTGDSIYQSQMDLSSCEVQLPEPTSELLSGEQVYRQAMEGILIFGKMYKCDKCPDDHILPASAFVISGDGICVSNYHVFKSLNEGHSKDYITAFVQDHKGNIYPVEEVLAASKVDDLSIFRINTHGTKMHAIPLGNDQNPGADIHLVHHPNRHFYMYGRGIISRTYIKQGTRLVRQSITAEFARGSSGAPVLDQYGNVAGVVEATYNIHYRPDKPSYQMSVREIIPVSRIRELIDSGTSVSQ